jgi:superfamily II RNA helicase
LDFQVRAIQALRAGANVLVSAPTGAGKTLVAEYAIADAVARGRRCVYTAPVKALSNQKYRDFRDDPDVDVGLMTGDVTIAPNAQVLIMTTEILRNAILEDPSALADVDFVILDEVHYMDDIERGSVWEESLIFAPPQIRFVSLSATVKNLDQLGAWIGEIRDHELAVIHSTRRPVPLKHRIYTPKSGIFDPGRIDFVRKHEAGEAAKPKDANGSWGRKPRGRSGGRRNERVRRGGSTGELMDLFGTLSQDDKFPALVFSFSRKDCERLAQAAGSRQLLDEAECARMEALQRELIDLFQLNEQALVGEVFSLARRGIGYHHAGMLPLNKEVVERMFTSGLIKLLFTTETFAIGINMPARSVVFTSLRKFDGVTFDYLRTRDYMQMAGRAGRQGIDTMGLVVSFLDERDVQEAPVERLVSGKPEPVESRFRLSYATILHLIEHLGRERLIEAWEKSFNQFQHRGKSRKARESNRAVQRSLVDAHLNLLRELNYLDDEAKLTARGRVGRLFYGYELQVTELLFQGVLEDLPANLIAQVFVGLVHSARRREQVRIPQRFFGDLREDIDKMIRKLMRQEAEAGLTNPLKEADWGLAPAIDRWLGGAELEDLEDDFEGTSGDMVRTMRQSLQLMRQVRRTLDPRDNLYDRMADAIQGLNREEVDAQRQLELG